MEEQGSGALGDTLVLMLVLGVLTLGLIPVLYLIKSREIKKAMQKRKVILTNPENQDSLDFVIEKRHLSLISFDVAESKGYTVVDVPYIEPPENN